MIFRPVLALAAFKLSLHFFTNLLTPYGFHRDELLYLAMGEHLRLWSMDFPPAIALLAVAVRSTLGDSLVAIRLIPALFSTALVVLAGLTARELGGGRFAQGLAALAVIASPLFLRSGNLFQPVVLDQFAWGVGLYALIRLCRGGVPTWWVILGTAIGFGLLAKFSIAFFGLAVFLSLLITRHRTMLLTPWPWLALAIVLVLGSPSIVGQIQLGFPVAGQMEDLRVSQLERVTPVQFLLGQLLWGPGTALALVGLGGLLAAKELRQFSLVGWTCLLAGLILLLLQGKPYYLGPIYPVLFGAGAMQLERLRHPRAAPALRWSMVFLVIGFGAVILPLGIPILPPPQMAQYTRALGLTAALRTNTGEQERLPQDYADMLGWEEQVAAMARVWRDLPPEDQAEAVIVAGNYGEAGALDLFGPRYGLPRVVSPAGSFWFFGPGPKPGKVVLTIGVGSERLAEQFGSVETASRITHSWAVEEERELSILVARRPKTTLQEIWPSLAGQN